MGDYLSPQKLFWGRKWGVLHPKNRTMLSEENSLICLTTKNGAGLDISTLFDNGQVIAV